MGSAAQQTTRLYGGAQASPFSALVSTWFRPTADGFVEARYESTEFFVPTTGTYQFEHRVGSGTFENSAPSLERFLYLYGTEFDPGDPDANRMLAVEGPSDAETVTFEAFLLANVRYEFVVSTVDRDPPGYSTVGFEMLITGPARVRQNRCRFTDDVDGDNTDTDPITSESGLAFPPFNPHGHVCATVYWTGLEGQGGEAMPSVHRTEDSVFYWFFEPENLEVQVKLVDGCAINDRKWVLVSASTDLAFTVLIEDEGRIVVNPESSYSAAMPGELPLLRYDFPGGPATSIVDVEAVLCD